MTLEQLIPQLLAAETALREEFENWQTLGNKTWIDAEILQQALNDFEQETNSKTQTLTSEAEDLFIKISNAFEANQAQFGEIQMLYEHYKELIEDFSGSLQDTHIPDFEFAYDSLEDEINGVIDYVGEKVEALLGFLEDEVAQRIENLKINTFDSAEGTRNQLDCTIVNIQEKIESVRVTAIEAFETNSKNIENKQSETHDNTNKLKGMLDEKLDELLNSLTADIRQLMGNFEDVGRELNSIQRNIQYTMNTASECMKLCGVGMNSGANSLNSVKSCLDGIV